MTQRKLVAVLASRAPGNYCLAVRKARKRNSEELEATLNTKWKKGSVWRMTKVGFTDDKAAYVHTSFKLAIDIRTTQWTALLTEPLPLPSVPSPTR